MPMDTKLGSMMTYDERLHDHSGIFPSIFLQQENGSKNSILK